MKQSLLTLLTGLPSLMRCASLGPNAINENICRFASSVLVTGTGANGLSTEFSVPFGQDWVDIGQLTPKVYL